jgi:hypothetical protein
VADITDVVGAIALANFGATPASQDFVGVFAE